MEFLLKVLSVDDITHDVKRIRTERPEGYSFVAGQATELAINKQGWNDKRRPFTFTSLNEDPYLEFTIKCYTDHNGVTNELQKLQPGDELIIGDAWGAIEYKGPGYFIAGGAGITPFLAILRRLHKEEKLYGNKLFFSNKTQRDIIEEKELKAMLGDDAVFITTVEKTDNYPYGFINSDFLKQNIKDFKRHFYVCGPDKMIEDIKSILQGFGVSPETVVFEK